MAAASCWWWWLCCSLVLHVAGKQEEGSCDLEEGNCRKRNEGLYHHDDYYMKLINISLINYHSCDDDDGGGCGCFTPVISGDLTVWSQRGGIHQDDFLFALDQSYGGVHYQIINHVIYRHPQCSFMARCKGVEHFLLQVVELLPDMEFIINVRDHPLSSKHFKPLPFFSFSKTSSYYDIMYPAWSFWCGGPSLVIEPQGIGRWDIKRETLSASSKVWSWEKKKNVGFFRGSRTSSERDPLILLSREYPQLVDAKYTKNQAWRSEKDTLGDPPADIVSLEDHCQYKYLFNFRGVAASFRLKHLFLCKSLVLHVGHEWEEYFYPSLHPWVHYVPLSQNLHNSKEILEFFITHDNVAKEIASRGFSHIWEHLSMESISCYWKKLLMRYSELCTWRTEKQESFIIIN